MTYEIRVGDELKTKLIGQGTDNVRDCLEAMVYGLPILSPDGKEICKDKDGHEMRIPMQDIIDIFWRYFVECLNKAMEMEKSKQSST